MSPFARLLFGVVLFLCVAPLTHGDLRPLSDDAGRNASIVYNVPASVERAVVCRNVTGEHFAAKLWLKDGKQAILVDGLQQDSYAEVTMPFVGNYGARIAYIADKTKLVVDGKVVAEHKEFPLDSEEAVVFSADAAHMAYCASDGDAWFVSKDGERSASYKSVWSPAMPADGTRLAFCAENESGDLFVVVDGEVGQSYEDVCCPVFSDDGKHYAYGAKTAGEWVVVRDGAQEPNVYGGFKGFVFSSDGGRFAFGAKLGGSEFVVVDGQPKDAHDEVTGLAFSPDGSRFAYAARTDLEWSAVVDDKAGRPYASVRAITFMPDSKDFLYVIKKGKNERMVLGTSELLAFPWLSDPVSSARGLRAFYMIVTGPQYDRADQSLGYKSGAHVYQAVMGIGIKPRKP